MAPGSATEPLLLRHSQVPDGITGVREVVIQLNESHAGILLLVGAGERHTELQQIVGRLCPFRVALVALSIRRGRLSVFLSFVITLTEPVLSIASQRIVGMILDKSPKCLFCSRIVSLFYQTICKIILIGGGPWR